MQGMVRHFTHKHIDVVAIASCGVISKQPTQCNPIWHERNIDAGTHRHGKDTVTYGVRLRKYNGHPLSGRRHGHGFIIQHRTWIDICKEETNWLV